MTAAGTRHASIAFFNVRWLRPPGRCQDMLMAARRHCLRIHIANQHFGKGVEARPFLSAVAQIRGASAELLSELAEVNGVDRVSSVQAYGRAGKSKPMAEPQFPPSQGNDPRISGRSRRRPPKSGRVRLIYLRARCLAWRARAAWL